ncbi:hypothetical protein PoB_004752400 [Plakobranchus ocellatus]|uniref:Uncharacterized protein n=1 Tax=Plakobranchus ocellatus TaxID=259542 RepID=A0AAV4BLK2_9GAST|nr:hypothetical protein PoB_004752400 [Plakobranchus ocellatus]
MLFPAGGDSPGVIFAAVEVTFAVTAHLRSTAKLALKFIRTCKCRGATDAGGSSQLLTGSTFPLRDCAPKPLGQPFTTGRPLILGACLPAGSRAVEGGLILLQQSNKAFILPLINLQEDPPFRCTPLFQIEIEEVFRGVFPILFG